MQFTKGANNWNLVQEKMLCSLNNAEEEEGIICHSEPEQKETFLQGNLC